MGTAIRILAIGQGVSAITGQQTTVSVTSNELVGNRFGLIADGGFPPLNTSTTVPSGNITLTLGGNQFINSCQANMLVTLARHTRGLGLPTNAAVAGYVKNSTYTVNLGGNLPWSEVWYSHLAQDNGVALQNTLIVDGVEQLPGTFTAYAGNECVRPSTTAWIGLKNSDDVGTKFDLLTEIRRNGNAVGTGLLTGVNGGSSGFNNAVERTVAMAFNATPMPAPGNNCR